MTKFLEAANNEGLVEFQGDRLRKTALVQAHVRTNDDNGTRGVVDALTEEVFTETALLTLNHVGKGLQGAVALTQNRTLATLVVEERVDGLLEHTLFVADDDVRRVEFDELLQTRVAVDDASIEVVQVGNGEGARFELDERTQIRRNNRDHVENHPLGFVKVRAVLERFDETQTRHNLLFALTRFRRFKFFAQLFGKLGNVEFLEELTDRFGAHFRDKFLPLLLSLGALLAILVFF